MSRKLPAEFQLKIEYLANNGEGVGFLGGREIHIFGAYPGELVLAKPITRKKRTWKAFLLKVLEPSKYRRKDSCGGHYLSCGPWQTLSEDRQVQYKKDLVVKAFKGLEIELPQPDIVSGQKKFNYRNKMEFSITQEESLLRLALHKRYRHSQYSELKSCSLAEERINQCARHILSHLNEAGIKKSQLKNLVLRYSIYEDRCLAILYVVDKDFPKINLINNDISGWQIIYSDPLSPAVKTTEVLCKEGSDTITEEVSGRKLKYYYDSFFQINPRAFEDIIVYLKENIKNTSKPSLLSFPRIRRLAEESRKFSKVPIFTRKIGDSKPKKSNPKNKKLIDLYSGVGTIGLCLSDYFEEIYAVEFDKKAAEISRQNARQNNIENFYSFGSETEKKDLREFLGADDFLVVDPPRSGMHPKAIKQILEIAPENFIYVSCNPFTQLQDMQDIKEKYKIKSWRLFDIYPQTPHLESVLILKRKK